MPNLAATETSGAVGQRTRTLSFALFFLIIACGIVYSLRWDTVRNLMLARVLTLPASIALSAVLYRALCGLF